MLDCVSVTFANINLGRGYPTPPTIELVVVNFGIVGAPAELNALLDSYPKVMFTRSGGGR